MNRFYRAVTNTGFVLLLAFSLSAEAGPMQRLTERGAMLCDDRDQVCIRGSITYRSNPRLLELRGRVERASGSGWVRIRVVGKNRDGFTRRTLMEFEIRGHYSEIVDQRLITDHPDVDAWMLESISFLPAKN